MEKPPVVSQKKVAPNHIKKMLVSIQYFCCIIFFNPTVNALTKKAMVKKTRSAQLFTRLWSGIVIAASIIVRITRRLAEEVLEVFVFVGPILKIEQ